MQDKVYAQVYSIIRTFTDGLLDALDQFSKIGYDGVELVGTNTGGLSEDEFIARLKELKLNAYGMQLSGKPEDIPFAKKLGLKYVSTGVTPTKFTLEEALNAAKELNEKGKALKAEGLQLVLHNHSEEFFPLKDGDGKKCFYDVIMENTNPEYLCFQYDIGWAALAGADVVSYIKKAPERFLIIHVKECTRVGKDFEEMEHFPRCVFNENLARNPLTGAPLFTQEQKDFLYESRNWNGRLGKGIVDWKAVKEAATSCIAFVNEREYYHYEGSDGTAPCCAKLDYEYLRSL